MLLFKHMPKTINWYHRSSKLVIAFGVLALVTNLINILFFSFDQLSADGLTYTKDFLPLLQGVLYLAITLVAAYFIRRGNKPVAIVSGLFAMLIGLSTFWLTIFRDGANLVESFGSAEALSLTDILLNMWLFYFVTSLISITLCIMITGTTFKAVFGKN